MRPLGESDSTCTFMGSSKSGVTNTSRLVTTRYRFCNPKYDPNAKYSVDARHPAPVQVLQTLETCTTLRTLGVEKSSVDNV